MGRWTKVVENEQIIPTDKWRERQNSAKMEKGHSKRNFNQMNRLKMSEVRQCCIKTLGGMKQKTRTPWKRYIC